MKNKTLSILLLGMLLSLTAYSQTWSELFEQKKTQEKYLLIQLGALKVQSQLLKDASQIFQSGLGLLSSWKDAEFLAHQDFFEARRKLGAKSESVLKRMADEGLLPGELEERIEYSQNYWRSKNLEATSREALSALHLKMLDRCRELASAYMQVSSGNLEMEDGQRAELLMGLHGRLFELSADLNRIQVLGKMNLEQREFEEGILKGLKGPRFTP
jgi:hypothetical protein